MMICRWTETKFYPAIIIIIIFHHQRQRQKKDEEQGIIKTQNELFASFCLVVF
jgi:hypothetical protein